MSEVAQSAAAASSGPVGQGDYVVNAGDCISSIARASGHFWKKLWDLAANAELKRARGDPNILLEGDLVTVPPLEPREESCATEKTHKFVRKGEPAKLRLQIMLEDSTPRANSDYVLNIDGKLSSGKTDGEGKLEVWIPPDARKGTITFCDDNCAINLELGSLDPIDQISGIKGRLNNLGYNCGPADDDLNSATKAALKHFQKKNGLEPSGAVDDQTRTKLKQVHGS
jgi:hypothetical protein